MLRIIHYFVVDCSLSIWIIPENCSFIALLFHESIYSQPVFGCRLIVVTSVTLRPGRNAGGETPARFASDDGSLVFTKLSELLEMESKECGA